MDINKLLEYQAVDTKLFKIEKDILDSDSRKKMVQAYNTIKSREELLANYDSTSVEILAKYDKAVEEIKRLQSEIEEIENSLEISDNVESLNFLIKKASAISQRISELFKELNEMTDGKKNVVGNAQKVTSEYKEAVATYTQNKKTYDEYRDSKAKEAEAINQELARKRGELAKDGREWLERYLQLRKARVFPVVATVQTNANRTEASCEKCGTFLSRSHVNKLAGGELVICEQCQRILYMKGDK